MLKIVYKLVKLIMKAQDIFLACRLKMPANMVFSHSTTKTSISADYTLKLAIKTEEKKARVNKISKQIIKKNIKSPEKLLKVVEEKGTDVYRIPFADKILGLIGEEEGFVTPLKGFKALYLNLMIRLFTEKKLSISFSTKEMFVLRDLPIDIYIMSHQFHKWCGFRTNLPGYDYETQEKFKKLFKNSTNKGIENCPIDDVLAIKEAIARNIESIDFVINLAKEYDGSKKSLAKLMSAKGASI